MVQPKLGRLDCDGQSDKGSYLRVLIECGLGKMRQDNEARIILMGSIK